MKKSTIIFLCFCIFVSIGIIITTFSIVSRYAVIVVNGNSMAPSYIDGDRIFIQKSDPEINGLIVFNPSFSWINSVEENKHFVKRIIALPGDNISIINNVLTVNSSKGEFTFNLCEYNLLGHQSTITNVQILDIKGYFVMGDACWSTDSLTEFFRGNPDFLIHENQIILTGTKNK